MRYRIGPWLAARSSVPLQLQFESMVDIWHQKLSKGLKGVGGASFFSGTGKREIRLALTAGALRCTGDGTCGIGDGLRCSIAMVELWFAGGCGDAAGTLLTAGAFTVGALATAPRVVLASGVGAAETPEAFAAGASAIDPDSSSLPGGNMAEFFAVATVVRAGWARWDERGLQSA